MPTSILRYAGVLAVALAACGGSPDEPATGAPPDASTDAGTDASTDAPPGPNDADGDGVADADDCAPTHPGLHHTLAFAFRDHDGDQRYVAEAGTVCAGVALPAGYRADAPTDELDCDDTRAAAWRLANAYPDTDLDGYGVAPVTSLCTGDGLPSGWAISSNDCAATDATRWQLLSYSHRDADGDGAWAVDAGELCSGAALPAGYSATAPAGELDCAPADPALWRAPSLYPDSDGDGVGVEPSLAVCVGVTVPAGWASTAGDCAATDASAWRMLPYGYRDQDGDDQTVLQVGTICAGTALPLGYRTGPTGDDCDDADRTLWRTVALYADTDRDSVGAGASTATCLGATLPPATSLAGTDCAATDPSAWRLLPYGFVDRDRDQATVASAGSTCSGTALLPPYYAAASGADCDDEDPALTGYRVTYADLDRDGVGAAPRAITCLGAELPPGRRLAGYDDDDGDPAVILDQDSEDEELDLILN